MALHNLASLPHISVAGAVATGTHGSGDANGNLATAVAALELVTSERRDRHRCARRRPISTGMVVGLGALGVVTRLTLDVEPAYEVRQRVFEGLAWDALYEHFDAITAAGDSVSVFTRWGERVDQVWVKSRVSDAPEDVRDELFGAPAGDRRPAPDPRHRPGQLHARSSACPARGRTALPHFRMGFTPSSGEELQSEYLVPRGHAVAALARRARARRTGSRRCCRCREIRTIAADRLWMSPQYGRDTVAIHFTWRREPDAVARLLAALEAGLDAVRRASALGQAVPRARPRDRRPLRAPARLPGPDRAPRSARCVPEPWLEACVLGTSTSY